MFVQIFKAPVENASAVRPVLLDWMEQHAPRAAADGWLGSTGGVTADGTMVAIGLFNSAEAARRNGDRAGQGDWWSELTQVFTGSVVFRNCTAVEVGRGDGRQPAGFVHVVEGKTSDRAGLRALSRNYDHVMTGAMPGLLGFVLAFHDEDLGGFTRVSYFPTEKHARIAQEASLSGEQAELMRRMDAVISDATSLDLHDPWIDLPASSFPELG